MKKRFLGILLSLALLLGLLPGMNLTAYATDYSSYLVEACTTEVGTDATETLTVYAKGISAGSATVTATSNADREKKANCDVTVNAAQTQTEELLTTITATGTEQASYSTANVATVSFSYTAGGSSAYNAIWGWWGYGWSATVNAAEGYNITKCIFYDDANRTATDSEVPFVVETTEEDKTPKVNGTPILAYTSKGIKKIEVYGYATPAHTHDFTYSASGATITATCGEGCDITEGLTLTISAPTGDLTADGTKTFPATLSTGYNTTAFPGTYAITYTKDGAEFTSTPTEAGEYTASVTVDTATASVSYTVYASKDTQTITASDVTATYGDTDKNISATTDGNGEISYTVKAGSENYIDVNASTGALTIKAVPAVGKAYVTVTASETNTGGTGGKGYAAATKDVTVNISKATVTIAAKDQSIYVGGMVPTLSGADFYTVTGLVGEETLTTNPTLTYQKNGKAATPDSATAGTYDIVPSGAAASDNYSISYTNGTLTISNKGTQTISAENVTATYGDTDKSVSATVTDPATGGGDISYAVKEGSGDYIDMDATTGALTIKKVPADGKAYVTVTAAETATYAQATKDVTVTISKANAVPTTVTANNRTYDGTEKPLVTVTGEATGGTMQYALGTATEATEQYTTSIPTATNAETYYVWYKVVGDENHNDTEPACVEVTINKATPSYTAPTGLTATYGDTLSAVILPTGWAWVDSTQSVGNVGTNTFKANFTPADTANYNTVSGVDITVTVGKAAGKDAVISTDTMTYNADSIYIEGVAGQEYVIVPKGTAVTDADWNTSVKPDPKRENWVFFENLNAATEYEIYTRTAETETAFAGAAVKADVYTTLSSIGYLYDSTLVGASITVEPEPDMEGLTYKWYQDTVTEDGEGAIHHNLTEIPGATGSTYTFRTEDAGKNIAVKIFAGDSEVGDFATDAPVALTAKVIFESKGGSDVETLTDAAYQSKIKAPADPTREGFAFDGWYWDEEFETPFDFEKDVITWTETTLYAKWTPNDYKITSVTGLTGANNKQWTKGGKDAVVITVEVSGEDNSFDHFTGVKLDGVELVKDVDYTAEKGSTVVTLKPETLEKLSVGEHTVTILFNNGEVNTTLTVLAASGGNATSPQTGDSSHLGIWIALMMLSLLGIAATLLYGRKKKVFGK